MTLTTNIIRDFLLNHRGYEIRSRKINMTFHHMANKTTVCQYPPADKKSREFLSHRKLVSMEVDYVCVFKRHRHGTGDCKAN